MREIRKWFQIQVSVAPIHTCGSHTKSKRVFYPYLHQGIRARATFGSLCVLRVSNDHSNECEQSHRHSGLFQMNVSDDPGHHGCTICDLKPVFFGKFVSEALRWSLSWAPVLCSSLFPFLFRVIASPCGFLLASLYLRHKGPLWTHVFSSFIFFFFFILESLCQQWYLFRSRLACCIRGMLKTECLKTGLRQNRDPTP